MKKITILICTFLCLGIVVLTACGSNKTLPSPKNTELEFWITQDVSSFDFSEHNQIYGIMGGKEYYGKGYQAVFIDEDQIYTHPEHYVIYTLTAYPDYSDPGLFVTQIKITDPAVNVYGITCASSFDEFDKTFKELGCDITDNGFSHVATYGKCKVRFGNDDGRKTIIISAEVTNNTGIMF